MEARHKVIQELRHLLLMGGREVRNDATVKLRAVWLLRLKSVLDVLPDLWNLDVLSAPDDCSLKCDQAIFCDLACLLEEPDNDHNNVGRQRLLGHVPNLDEHHLHQPTEQVLQVGCPFCAQVLVQGPLQFLQSGNEQLISDG